MWAMRQELAEPHSSSSGLMTHCTLLFQPDSKVGHHRGRQHARIILALRGSIELVAVAQD
jgi:hypothetical protein